MGKALIIAVIAVASILAGAVVLGPRLGLTSFPFSSAQPPSEAKPQDKKEDSDAEGLGNNQELQTQLGKLSSTLVSEIEKERRLNLGLYTQLKAYRNMLDQVQTYASKVEQDMDTIEEISKDEFQEDVALQASLFSGKKADVVAQHLEEFRASRVGAILAKMKEREASAVLDIWARNKDPKVSRFYRDVTSAYLTNKRFEAHPELFQKRQPPASAKTQG